MTRTYSVNLPQKLFKAQQVRENEPRVAADLSIEMFTLMENAGQAMFDMVTKHSEQRCSMTVLCGYGNNGGDGYIVARLAKIAGWQVKLIQLGDCNKITGDAATARTLWLEGGGKSYDIGEGIEPNTVVIDALLGTGLNGNVRGQFIEAIELVNKTQNAFVCSVDIPSGLNADTGQPMGCSIKADLTCTFVGLKQGMVTGLSGDYCGKLHFAGLGIDEAFEQAVSAVAQCSNASDIEKELPPRKRACHKGNNGHVLLIGGNKGLSGAIRMAAKACMRTGAGLVSVLTVEANESIVAADCAEVMVRGICGNSDINVFLAKADVIVFGPGSGVNDWSKVLLQKVLAVNKPKIIDADGLNLLALDPVKLSQCIITPHPKEAARMLSCSVKDIQQNRFESAAQLAKSWGAVALLKGFGTVINDGSSTYVNTSGNPGMATAGMGDVLSGIIGGLLAQGLSLRRAATLGALIHGAAGDAAAAEGERGMMATDLLPHIRALVNPF
ncbi:MAG: NAD(P)H-hydrate dehydratase [Algicola sp.]|nr:NAD(P)H-hydrate dehydratase [Algicola sp.]